MFALVVVLLTGLLVTNLIGRRLIVWGEELLNRIPVVRTVYGGVKSFAESVFSQPSSFRKVVMVEYPRPGTWSIGFLTAEDVPEVSEKLGEPHVAVYISAALNATAGYLVILPRRQVVELDMSVDAALKMIITCGVVVPPAPPCGAHSWRNRLPEASAPCRRCDCSRPHTARAARSDAAAARPARSASARRGLRRVPHRPASARRRAAGNSLSR